jgi:hypothetical protein
MDAWTHFQERLTGSDSESTIKMKGFLEIEPHTSNCPMADVMLAVVLCGMKDREHDHLHIIFDQFDILAL